jgi:hypothetical protein
VACAVIVALALAGCGSGSGGDTGAKTGATTGATTTAAAAGRHAADCLALWNSKPFAGGKGERRLIAEQRDDSLGRPFPVLTRRDQRGVCVVVIPDTRNGIDSYSFEGGDWANYILPAQSGWGVLARGTFEEVLEPIAEAHPDAALRRDGTLVPYSGPGVATPERETADAARGRKLCGTTDKTPAGAASPAQEVVKGLSCDKGMAVFHEHWRARRHGGGPLPSGFACRQVTSVELCEKSGRYVELNYGV